MSQQAALWARYHAAALQRFGPEAAADTADLALAEYNKRFETLAKHEADMAELGRTLELREEQEYIGLRALMAAGAYFEALGADARLDQETHWMSELRQLVRNHLRLIKHTWTIVPHGVHEDDPKLKTRGSR